MSWLQLGWWWCLATLCLGTSVSAQTIQGYVLHASSGQRLAQVEVAFLVGSEDGSMTPMTSTTSDSLGRFEFSGPFLTTGTQFALRANYDGVDYPSSVLQVGAQDEIIIEVYAAGDDASGLRIINHNIFLGLIDQTVEAAHLVQADNGAEQTYVGPLVDGHIRGLEFVVPEGLASLTPHTGELVRLSATRIFDTQPLPPGPSHIAFTFQIDPEVFDGSYVHEVVYPTQHLDVFIQPVEVQLGGAFQDLGIVNLHSQQYRHYRTHDLLPGQRLNIDLPISRPLRWALKWVLLALVPAILVGVTAMARRPVSDPATDSPAAEHPQSTTPDAPLSQTQVLQQLAQVRSQRANARGEEARKLDQQYQELMTQAREIYRQQTPA